MIKIIKRSSRATNSTALLYGNCDIKSVNQIGSVLKSRNANNLRSKTALKTVGHNPETTEKLDSISIID